MKLKNWLILFACIAGGMLAKAELPDAESTLKQAQETMAQSNYVAKQTQQGAKIIDYYKVMPSGKQLNRSEIIMPGGTTSVTLRAEDGTYELIGNLAIKQPESNVSPPAEESVSKQYSIEEVDFKNIKCYKILESIDTKSTIYFVNQETNMIHGQHWLDDQKAVRLTLEYDSVEIKDDLSDELFLIPDSYSVRHPKTLSEATDMYSQEVVNENVKNAQTPKKKKELWEMTPEEAIQFGALDMQKNKNKNKNTTPAPSAPTAANETATAVEEMPFEPESESRMWVILLGIGCAVLITVGVSAFIFSLKKR